jgi:hypothetical protein
MAKKGYFILTDISGYTEFLARSELDHAQDALQNLFDVQLAHIKYPFVISGFRGDAIFHVRKPDSPVTEELKMSSWVRTIRRRRDWSGNSMWTLPNNHRMDDAGVVARVEVS